MENSIFTKFGTVRTDLDTIKVAPERQPALDALVAAQLMCEASERELKEAEGVLTAAVRRRNDIAAKVPRTTFSDELRNSIRQYQQDHGR
jgi:hypothetical protein